jgi:predicted alpha/beta hydrolase
MDRGVVERTVRFAARDGYELGGTLFTPADKPVKNAAFIVSGTAIPAGLYHHFARFLSAHGWAVLTYDCRGIGASAPDSLRGFVATIEDWAEYDTGGAIDWVRAHYPGARYVAITHSFAAAVLFATPGAELLRTLVMFSPHTGYWYDYRLLYRLPMTALWHGFMPIVAQLRGYFPARRLRLGHDIPGGVALQWAGRRTAEVRPRGSPKQRARASEALARAHAISGTALVIVASDDAFSTDAGIRRVLQLVPHLRVDQRRIMPGAVGAARIGHFGLFRRKVGSIVWPQVLAWLDATG